METQIWNEILSQMNECDLDQVEYSSEARVKKGILRETGFAITQEYSEHRPYDFNKETKIWCEILNQTNEYPHDRVEY